MNSARQSGTHGLDMSCSTHFYKKGTYFCSLLLIVKDCIFHETRTEGSTCTVTGVSPIYSILYPVVVHEATVN